MVDFVYKDKYEIYDLQKIVKLLRSENGCPWDREQTHESIRRNFIEEACEAAEAIDEKNPEHLREELGDVLLQVMLHSEMEDEQGRFDLDGVADGICKKLILRHPHVFGDVTALTSSEVLVNWDAIKRVEKNQETVTDSMKAVSKALPALWRAEKVQKKAAKVGFDWPELLPVLDKLEEELGELRQAVAEGKGVEEELGDLLFTAANAARHIGADPEDALNSSCEKFIARFELLEQAVQAENEQLAGITPDKMDKLYTQAKETIKKTQEAKK